MIKGHSFFSGVAFQYVGSPSPSHSWNLVSSLWGFLHTGLVERCWVKSPQSCVEKQNALEEWGSLLRVASHPTLVWICLLQLINTMLVPWLSELKLGGVRCSWGLSQSQVFSVCCLSKLVKPLGAVAYQTAQVSVRTGSCCASPTPEHAIPGVHHDTLLSWLFCLAVAFYLMISSHREQLLNLGTV